MTGKYLSQKKFLLSLIIFMLLGLTLAFGGELLFSKGLSEDELIILHTNDEHGTIDNFGHIAYQKQQLQEEYADVLLVSAGDIFGGSPLVDQYQPEGKDLRGRPMVELMNRAGYDAMTVGNHEFDYGQKRLAEVKDRASFPLLLANVEAGEGAETGRFPAGTSIETTTGRKVSFLGLLQRGPDGIPSAHPAYLEGLSFTDPLQVAERYFAGREGSDLVVGLTHLGYSRDLELAKKLSGKLDLVVGGHSHRVIRAPEEVDGVFVTQAGSDTEYLGQVKIEFAGKEVEDISGKLIPVEDIEGTVPEIENKIDNYREEMEDELESVLYTFPAPLRGEEALGSLIADSLVEVHDLDFAFQHDGGIRSSILPPRVKIRDVYKLDPFDNNIVVRRMKPDEISNLIYSSFVRSGGLDLRVSGLRYVIKLNEAGEVSDIIIKNSEGDPLVRDKEYRVGMNSYLAESYFSDFPPEREEILYSYTTAETLIEYFRRGELADNYSSVERTGIRIERTGEVSGDKSGTIETPLSTKGKREKQVTAGTIMAEAAKNAAGADIGTYPSDQLKRNLSLAPGPLYEGILDIFYDSFNYDNTVVSMDITGKELEELFLSQVRWYDGNYPLQVSKGVKYDVIVKEDTVREVRLYLDGKRIKGEQIYSVAVNSFKYDYYLDEVEIVDASNTKITEREALIDYLEGR